MATKNQTRGTAGLALCLFTIVVLASLISGWEKRQHSKPSGSVEHLTALGDHSWYAIKGDEDMHQPGLIFALKPLGIFRRSSESVHKPDAKMIRVSMEKYGRWSVYREQSGTEGAPHDSSIYYLKSGENEFIEFGARNHWPAFTPATEQKQPD